MTIFNRLASVRFTSRFNPAMLLITALCSPVPTLWNPPRLEAAGPLRGRPETSEETLARTKRIEQIKHDAAVRHGKELFHREWLPRDTNTTDGYDDGHGDGLGPLFNARSCAACHRLGATGGAGGAEHNVQLLVVNRLPAGDKWETTFLAQRDFLLPTATGDTFLLHRFGTSPDYEQWRRERLSLVGTFGGPMPAVSNEARVRHLKSVGLDLAMVPSVRDEGSGLYTASGSLVPETPTLATVQLEERNTTALFGAGLIDKVREETLVAIVAEQDTRVRGRIPHTASRRLGRFGWKGQHETLLEFNAGACAAELGLDTKHVRQAKAPSSVSAAPYANLFNISKGVDVQPEEIEAMTTYVASLPAPTRPDDVQRNLEIHAGEELFGKIGCAQCHRPSVGDITEIYSDLLLHDIGLNGSNSSYYGGPPIDLVGTGDPKRSAGGNEFRTPPLWGVADSAPYLHDGRAKNLRDAINAHGGQAGQSSRQFALLNLSQQKQLLKFLGSLKAPRTVR